MRAWDGVTAPPKALSALDFRDRVFVVRACACVRVMGLKRVRNNGGHTKKTTKDNRRSFQSDDTLRSSL